MRHGLSEVEACGAESGRGGLGDVGAGDVPSGFIEVVEACRGFEEALEDAGLVVRVGVVDAAVDGGVVSCLFGTGGVGRVVGCVEGGPDFTLAPLGVDNDGEELFFVERLDLGGGGEEGVVDHGAAFEEVTVWSERHTVTLESQQLTGMCSSTRLCPR